MLSILASDFIKIRRKLIWFLIFLGPFGVVALQAVNFGLRYDYLTKVHEKDLWAGLIGEAGYLAIPALMLGLTLIASTTDFPFANSAVMADEYVQPAPCV